jgi:signal peptidase I
MTAQTESHTGPNPRPHWIQVIAVGRNPRMTLLRIAVLIVVCFGLFGFVLVPVQVDGISMSPTYKNRSINLINEFAYKWREPRRGDVVAVQAWAGQHALLMKRIIGLPGETVTFNNGRVFIDGKILDEPYEKGLSSDWTLRPEKLGADQYFIVGDNRTMQWQLHTFGKVHRDRIIGKILL